MKKPRTVRKSSFSITSGDDALSTLGEELLKKYPDMLEKVERFHRSDKAVRRKAEPVLELFPYDWRDPEYFLDGVMHCVRGNYLGALGVFSDLMEKEPEAYPVYHMLGYVCGSMGKHKLEADYYRKALKLKPDSVQVYYDLAISCWLMGKDQRAYAAMKDSVQRVQDFNVADHWLTYASDNLGRYIDPDTLAEKEEGEKVRCLAQAYYMLGHAFIEYGLNAEARTAFKNALRIQPKFADAYFELGALHIKKLRNKERRKKYLKEAEHLYAQKGDLLRASMAQQLNQSREEAPEEDSAEEWMKEGLRLQTLGLYQRAIDAYKMAIAFEPNFLDAYYNMGVAYGSLEEQGMDTLVSAIGAFKQSIRLKPDFIHAHIALAAAYLRRGEYRDVIYVLEKAREVDPDNYNVYYYLGTAYRFEDQLETALDMFERAARLAPDSLQVRFSLGLACMDCGNHDAARDAFVEVLRIKPDFPDAHYLLGYLYREVFHLEEPAVAHLKKAEKLYLKLKDHDRVAKIRQLLVAAPE
ncbi:tetratricopeptide (TPR) repeat protein [Nitrospina gracilis]|uniref:tetratricopeptide repeat protein n=1 Tax=Nitrospina sp. Nb-3 TaxID=2940485 RepID=UPI001F200AD4|nr:tetratricopeptide repeat protein [Nitrospina sp. Nb-3]MCF8722361.1 tetratricopeptide (TPR) repeat protein [Nitrospina sp. Nb-3]